MKSVKILSLPFLVFVFMIAICSTDKAATVNAQSSGSNSATAANASSSADQQFLENAIKGNRAEVELGRMMESKATDPQVKQFAQLMVKDHSEALNQVQQLAQKKSSASASGLPPDAQDLKQKLSQEHGAQLDKDYVNGMLQDHQKDVKEYQDEAQNGQDPQVKQWAGKMVPKLQEHLQKVEALNSTVNKGQ